MMTFECPCGTDSVYVIYISNFHFLGIDSCNVHFFYTIFSISTSIHPVITNMLGWVTWKNGMKIFSKHKKKESMEIALANKC